MPKIILIAHQKGGVGKSTLTFNLATNIKESAKVAIIDTDLQGSLSKISQMSKVDILPIEYLEKIDSLDYDFIFIDTPPYLMSSLEDLCTMADLIIVPTKVGVLDLFAIENTIDVIKSTSSEEKAMIVFNMVKPKTSLTADILQEASKYNIKIAKTMISDLVAFTRSVLTDGVEEDDNAQRQIDQLTKEVLTSII